MSTISIPESSRDFLVAQWDQAWEKGLWAAPWSRVLEGLTPERAAWKPAPERHSIWQILNHMLFWRWYVVHRLRGGELLSPDEVSRRNFSEPSRVDEAAWNGMVANFAASHREVRAALADPAIDLVNLAHVAAHDSYHVGQIMVLRSLQGMAVID